MNMRIGSEYKIFANMFSEDELVATRFAVNVKFITNSENPYEYATAINRASYFLNEMCENAIFVDDDSLEEYPELDNMGVDVIVLPNLACEQIIGIMLFCKLNAIMESKVLVDEISIKIDAGQKYEYFHNREDPLDMFEEIGWWHEKTLSIRHPENLPSEKRQKYFESLPSWADLQLEMDGDESMPPIDAKVDSDGDVLFVDFKKPPKDSEN